MIISIQNLLCMSVCVCGPLPKIDFSNVCFSFFIQYRAFSLFVLPPQYTIQYLPIIENFFILSPYYKRNMLYFTSLLYKTLEYYLTILQDCFILFPFIKNKVIYTTNILYITALYFQHIIPFYSSMLCLEEEVYVL